MTDPTRPQEGAVIHDTDLRGQIYVTVGAGGALLVAGGFFTAEEAQLWINLAVAVVALATTVLARLNLSGGRHARQ